jgi:hypothetical protein
MMKKFISAMTCLLLIAVASVQAGSYTNYSTSVGTAGGLPAIYSGGAYLLQSRWDTGTGPQQHGAIVSGDTIRMIPIPANTFVQYVGYYLNTPAATGSGASIAVGDSTASNTWVAATTITNGTPNVAVFAPYTALAGTNTTPVAVGKLYTSADYIKVTFSGTPSGLIFTVKALAYPVGQ